jgi:hypothetical protein
VVGIKNLRNYSKELGRLDEVVGLTACDTRWTKILEAFERQLNAPVAANPDGKGVIHTALLQSSTSFALRLCQMETAVLGNGWKRAEAEKKALGTY